MTKLVLVGGGRMGEALLGGLLSMGWASGDLAVVEVDPDRRRYLGVRFDGITVTDEMVAAEGAVIAVKPHDVPAVCKAMEDHGIERVLSIAAGVTIATLEGNLLPGAAVVRAMPNTPALLGAGIAAIAAGSSASENDLAWAADILGTVGEVVTTSEALLDAVTGLSGSGPAYVFMVAEALIDAGVLAGLPRETSTRLTLATLLGSARLLTETGDSPEILRAAVTSPGGTTAAGLRELERSGLRSAFIEAVMAAADRSKELGTL